MALAIDTIDELNLYVLVAMCSLVMSLCSCDVIKYYYNTLNSSGLAVV